MVTNISYNFIFGTIKYIFVTTYHLLYRYIILKISLLYTLTTTVINIYETIPMNIDQGYQRKKYYIDA